MRLFIDKGLFVCIYVEIIIDMIRIGLVLVKEDYIVSYFIYMKVFFIYMFLNNIKI